MVMSYKETFRTMRDMLMWKLGYVPIDMYNDLSSHIEEERASHKILTDKIDEIAETYSKDLNKYTANEQYE
jgi:hypothetical protein